MGEVEIVNLALSRLGESPIQRLDEGSAAATAANVVYESARKAALRSYQWNFALKVSRLARVSDTPVDFDFSYALPADCLRAIRLVTRERQPLLDDRNVTGFALRGGILFTDVPEVTLEYVADIRNPELFDDSFVDAFSYILAANMAPGITGDDAKMQGLLQMAKTFLPEAAALSGRERRDNGTANAYADARN